MRDNRIWPRCHVENRQTTSPPPKKKRTSDFDERLVVGVGVGGINGAATPPMVIDCRVRSTLWARAGRPSIELVRADVSAIGPRRFFFIFLFDFHHRSIEDFACLEMIRLRLQPPSSPWNK